jgi:TonB-dependent receptor
MKKLFTAHVIIFFILFSPFLAFAQNTIQGIVSDSLSDNPLIGANVILLGTAMGSASNFDGEYSITDVPAGTYTLKVSYIGYRPKEYEVNVADKTIQLDIFLIPDIIEGEEVLITAQALGQVSAINQQRSSNTIINVVSEEKIKELPDANAAESIGRLPGVSILRSGGEASKVILRGLSDKYTNVTIDGIRISSTDSASRGLDLSIISQSSLAGIELYKALTPDKDGDAIAGSINLVTRKAPSTREIRVEMKGGYNRIMKSAEQYDFSLRYGERFLDDLLGVQLNGNIENKIRSNERINLDYDQTGANQTTYEINDFRVEFNDEIRKRNGLSVILDLNTPDEGSVKLNTLYSSTKRDYLTSFRDYPAGGGIIGGASGVTYSFRDVEQELETFNNALTGNNNLLDLKFYWGVSFAQSTSDYPYDYLMNFFEPSDVNSGMRNTPHLKTSPELLIPYAYNNFTAATLYNAFYNTQKNLDKERTAFLNISKEYVFGNMFSGEIKIGGKYRSKDRSNDKTTTYAPYYLGYWLPYERSADGTIQPKNFAGSYFEAFYQRYLQTPTNTSASFIEFLDPVPESRDIYDLYKLNPIINRDKLRQWYAINKNGTDVNGNRIEYNVDATARRNFYDITENVASAYIMNTLNIGQDVTFIVGVRVENEDNLYNCTYAPGQFGGFPFLSGIIRDTSSTYSENLILPNFHLNIKPTEFFNIRVAAYRSLARPDFNFRLNTAYAWRGTDVSSNRELYMGNRKLKTAKAWNFEINTSFFGNEIGLISLSVYYKEIKDMFHQLIQINTQGDVLLKHFGLTAPSIHSGTYQLTIPYNSPQLTKVWGFEFEHQINCVFLPGLLKNIVLSYNASIVRSETHLIATTIDTIEYFLPEFPGIPFYRYEDRVIDVKRQLEEQPEFYGNISLGYDIGGFSGRISLFHQSEYNLTFSPSGRSDQIINPFTRLDLALRYKFTDYLSVLFSVSNLTNIKEGNSINNRVNGYKILDTEERYGLTADLGVKLEL